MILLLFWRLINSRRLIIVSALQWYTQNSFLFGTINQTLRSSNVQLMFQFRYFLTDLYLQLYELHRQTRHLYQYSPCKAFYRGQTISRKEFHSFRQLNGHIISINTFFSTTTSFQVALNFANTSRNNEDYLPVIFCIITNLDVTNERPYGNISSERDEEEVLFAMGSIFCIEEFHHSDHTSPVPIIRLEMINPIVINDAHPL